jgi:hypothetical protein
MIENGGSSRMNICIDPEPALPDCSCSHESELPHLALTEFRPEHTMAYLQTFRPVLLLVLLTR